MMLRGPGPAASSPLCCGGSDLRFLLRSPLEHCEKGDFKPVEAVTKVVAGSSSFVSSLIRYCGGHGHGGSLGCAGVLGTGALSACQPLGQRKQTKTNKNVIPLKFYFSASAEAK